MSGIFKIVAFGLKYSIDFTQKGGFIHFYRNDGIAGIVLIYPYSTFLSIIDGDHSRSD